MSYETGWAYDQSNRTWRAPASVQPGVWEHSHRDADLPSTITRDSELDTRIALATTAFPSAPVDGQLFYETDTNILWAYDGGATRWDPFGGLSTYTLSATGAGTGTTTSTTYVDMPGPKDLAFVKRASHTTLLCWGGVSSYVSANMGLVTIGIRIASVDFDVSQFYFNDLSSHRAYPMMTNLSGISAGSFTARLRWKVSSGMTGHQDSGDVVMLTIQEVMG